MGNHHLEITARHMIPQIDHHGKMSPVLRVSTHIYGISLQIYGEIIHLLGKTRHVTPQIDNHRKSSPVPRVITHIYRISKGIDR